MIVGVTTLPGLLLECTVLLGGGASAGAQGWGGEFPTLSGERLLGMGQGGQPESEKV